MEVTVALAQTSADEERARNEQKALRMMEEAKDRGCDLICFPEMWLEIFFPQYQANRAFFDRAVSIPGPLVERFQKKAAKLRIVAVLNIYQKDGRGRYFNSSPVIAASGELLGISRMMHIPELPNYNETFYYWPGDTDYPVFDLGTVKIGVPICWDRHFPEHFRILALKGAELIVIPTAGSYIQQFQQIWEVEIQAAAAANQVFVGIANRVGAEERISFFGGSFLADPTGNVAARAPQGEEHLLVSTIDPDVIDETRKGMPFFRNRRPDTYKDLLRF